VRARHASVPAERAALPRPSRSDPVSCRTTGQRSIQRRSGTGGRFPVSGRGNHDPAQGCSPGRHGPVSVRGSVGHAGPVPLRAVGSGPVLGQTASPSLPRVRPRPARGGPAAASADVPWPPARTRRSASRRWRRWPAEPRWSSRRPRRHPRSSGRPGPWPGTRRPPSSPASPRCSPPTRGGGEPRPVAGPNSSAGRTRWRRCWQPVPLSRVCPAGRAVRPASVHGVRGATTQPVPPPRSPPNSCPVTTRAAWSTADGAQSK
jgi:hypothetical protein